MDNLKPPFPYSKPFMFKTFHSNKEKDREKAPLNISLNNTTSYKARIRLETPFSPEKHSRSLHNRLENAQKRIEHIEKDQKSVKRLLNNLRGTETEDSLIDSNVYLIEKIKGNIEKNDRNALEEGFFLSLGQENEGNRLRNEFFREILVKMGMFRKTYSMKSNIERVIEFIRRKIDRNSGLYYDFLNENNMIFLKIFIQILYDAMESFFLKSPQNSEFSNENLRISLENLKSSYEEKIAELNGVLLEKQGLLEELQCEKVLLAKTLGYHQKVLEDLEIQLENKPDFPQILNKIRLLLKDFKTIENTKTVDFRTLEAYNLDFNESKLLSPEKTALQRKIDTLEENLKNSKDLLMEKEKKEEEIKDLKKASQELRKTNEIKENECKGLQRKLEETRKEISGLSKDLLRNSKEKEELIKRINEENESLLRRNEEIVRKNETLMKENKALERKFEGQLIVFKTDLQKARKSVLDLTVFKNSLEKEKEILIKKLNEETETKERALREARLQEKKGLNEKIERYERNLQDLMGEKGLLEEKVSISEEKLRGYEEKIANNEKILATEKEKVLRKAEISMIEYRKELKELLDLDGVSLKDLKLLTILLAQTLEILSRNNNLPSGLLNLKEELYQKREEIWQRFNHNNEEFLNFVGIFNQKYELNINPEDQILEISNYPMNMNFERNNKSFSEISMKSMKNYESNKKEKIIEENVDMMIYLQACSLENMLEQLQKEQSKGNNNSENEEKNNLSYNADLEKINEMSEDEERHTQNSNP